MSGFRCPNRRPACQCAREMQKGDPAERVLRRDARSQGYLCLPGGWEAYCRVFGLTSPAAEREQRRNELQ